MITKNHSTPNRKLTIVLTLAMVMVPLVSCNLPGMPAATSTPSQTPTLPAALNSPTPLPPTATSTSTQTPPPSATATPSAVNILFSPGTTAAVQQGSIQPNQIQSYTLSAGQYQPMILILDSPNNDAYLAVYEADGSVLLDPAKKWNNWQWLLPKTELYTIQVIGGTTSENYTLTTKVAKRIFFPTGSSSITLNGSTLKGFVFSYTLGCKINQTMTVSLNMPASSVYLDIFGLATGPLLSSSTKVNTWTGVLPATQDYIIEVIPNNGQVVDYSLTVTVQ